jgi:ATP-binding cassette subfamily B (MDR/TAP) protein 1
VPSSGSILIGGHDISSINISNLRSLYGLVDQEPVLFNMSIRDNITYGDNARSITDNEIHAAIKDANIYELIQALPEVRKPHNCIQKQFVI